MCKDYEVPVWQCRTVVCVRKDYSGMDLVCVHSHGWKMGVSKNLGFEPQRSGALTSHMNSY